MLKILCLTIILLVAKFESAYAWGHLNDSNGRRHDLRLINKVIKNHKIIYCIEVKDSSFNYKSIETQLKMALSIWLTPLQDVGVHNITISSSNCVEKKFDLKIEIGSESIHQNVSAYETVGFDDQHAYSLIKINTDYVYKDMQRNKTYEPIDFKTLVPKEKNIFEFLQDISIINLRKVDELARILNLDHPSLYFSSYKTILHELGHSFGLCDLNGISSNDNLCDPLYMATHPDKIQPQAIMNDANYFYLTDDDKEGIKSLYIRFVNN